jgi:hypothetical protein
MNFGSGTKRGGLRFALLGPLLWFTLAAAGCPAREAQIEISMTGAGWLRTACSRDRACIQYQDGGIAFVPEPSCACVLPEHPIPDLDHRALQARLFLATPSDGRIRDASKCMTLLSCGDGGTARQAKCMADSLNQQLDGAIPNGLGFDGLQNPNEVQLILAFYQPPDPMGTGASCLRDDLVACAGLAPPLGGGSYDISCASCQGGTKAAPGPDNGPCPKGLERDSCFLQKCDELLAANGFD